jgi:hypothetical protein
VRDKLNCLKPVRLAVEALSSLDANLLTSERIFKFLFLAVWKNEFRLEQCAFKRN